MLLTTGAHTHFNWAVPAISMLYLIEGNQIIVVTDNDIRFGKYGKLTLKKFSEKINNNEIPERLTGIPINYIKEIKVDPKSKNIIFNLGKSSTEILSFKKIDNRNIILSEILNNNNFKKDSSEVSVVYKKFLKLFFLISLLFLGILIGNKTTSSGYSLGGRAIGLISLWLKENLEFNFIIFLYILSNALLFWGFGLNLKKEKRTVTYRHIIK